MLTFGQEKFTIGVGTSLWTKVESMLIIGKDLTTLEDFALLLLNVGKTKNVTLICSTCMKIISLSQTIK